MCRENSMNLFNQLELNGIFNYNIFMSTRAKYTRVRPQEEKNEAKPDTDILMRFSERYGKYVARALTLFLGEDKKFVTIKAAERLIDRALWVAEVVRRKVEGLHQVINITERKTVDIYEPREEGLLEVRQERFITVVQITLTREPTADQKKAPGYHVPLKGDGSFLTKESWAQGEKERQEKREARGDRNESRGENREDRRDRGDRGDRGERRERNDRPRENRNDREERGGERRRGGDRRGGDRRE